MKKGETTKTPVVKKATPEDPRRPWDGDARNLSHLIDALVSSLHEADFVKADGSRNKALDRVSALAWIARDLAEELMINTSK